MLNIEEMETEYLLVKEAIEVQTSTIDDAVKLKVQFCNKMKISQQKKWQTYERAIRSPNLEFDSEDLKAIFEYYIEPNYNPLL